MVTLQSSCVSSEGIPNHQRAIKLSARWTYSYVCRSNYRFLSKLLFKVAKDFRFILDQGWQFTRGFKSKVFHTWDKVKMYTVVKYVKLFCSTAKIFNLIKAGHQFLKITHMNLMRLGSPYAVTYYNYEFFPQCLHSLRAYMHILKVL